jgi:RHS repeat-associated protein
VWSPVYVNALIIRDQSSLHNGTLDQRFYVVQDANWNVTALVNTSGTVVERYAYLPFGAVTVMNGSWSTISGSAYGAVYLFQGMRQDGASGLYETLNRWYSPTLGRWTTDDPKRFVNGLNLYTFVGNDPTIRLDPLGTAWWKRQRIRLEGLAQMVGGGIAVIGGGASLVGTEVGGPIGVAVSLTIVVVGVDLVMHGAHKFWYGEDSPTYVNQTVTNTTGSGPLGDMSEIIESFVGTGSGGVKVAFKLEGLIRAHQARKAQAALEGTADFGLGDTVIIPK